MEVIKQRRIARKYRPCWADIRRFVVMNIPGGVRKGLSEQERDNIIEKTKGFIEFAKFTLLFLTILSLQ